MTPPRETVDEWIGRWLESRRARGVVDTSRYQWDYWFSPHLGHLAWDEVRREHIEAARDAIDAAIAERRKDGPGRGRLLPRTAVDLWSRLRLIISQARKSKRADLRVLQGLPDPSEDVLPPGEGPARSRIKPFLFPTEFDRLVRCKSVHREWRRVYAIGSYLYLRPGELFALAWSDIDLSNGIAQISRSWDFELGEPKGMPKTLAGVRTIPLGHLLPLLERMRSGAAPDDQVLPILTEPHRVSLSGILRRHLREAGIERTALFVTTLTSIRINFRSLRDTGITWGALAGIDLARLSRRAGHADVRMTMRYVKQAEDLLDAHGKPFRKLPKELFR